MEAETKLRIFLNNQMPLLIEEAIENCFSIDFAPEVCWHVFRKELTKIKKRHKELHNEYLEMDDNSIIEDSEISKWRQKQNKQKE